MAENEKCPLVWEWDEGGEWAARSRVMDPWMVDEPQDEWCREWCLEWVIYVDEAGLFWCDTSDKLLFKEASRTCGGPFDRLDLLKAKIDLVEDYLRTMKWPLGEVTPVTLLPAEKYVR